MPGGQTNLKTVLSSIPVETRPYAVAPRHPLSAIVRAYESFSARRINAIRRTPGLPAWHLENK
jgi:hypothetical protein